MSEKTAVEICEAWMAMRFEYWCEFLRKKYGGVMSELKPCPDCRNEKPMVIVSGGRR